MKVDTHTFVSVYFPFTGARANAWFAVPGFLILFLDKMVNTILSCESFAGRRWRREMYGLTFFAATPLAAETAAE